MIYIEDLYYIHILVAKSELSGQFVENSRFKRKGGWIVPLHFVRLIISDNSPICTMYIITKILFIFF